MNRAPKPTLELDRSLPVLIAKIGRYPLHHGGLGAIRSLGRLGVPVYAITEDRFTPAAVSRYLRGRFVWPTTGAEDPAMLVEGLIDIGRRLDGRALLIPTDDEAAVLVGTHAAELEASFVFPAVPANLPEQLADKLQLYELCRAHRVPAPATARPASVDDLLTRAAEIGYPVVLKNAEPWARLRLPAVGSTTVVHDEGELRAVAYGWPAMPKVLLQEYLPEEATRDWIVGVYCDDEASAVLRFTGIKVRSWPPHAGVTARAFAAPNDDLAELTSRFCKEIGFRGIGDLDWRFDSRDGQYKLLDFNPRVGAQFRLFETDAGIDVVRALHLESSGRPIPAGLPRYDRGLRVENLDIPALFAYRGGGGRRPADLPRGHTERAWLAFDDVVPAAVAAVRSVAPAAAMLGRAIPGRAIPGRRQRAARPANRGAGGWASTVSVGPASAPDRASADGTGGDGGARRGRASGAQPPRQPARVRPEPAGAVRP